MNIRKLNKLKNSEYRNAYVSNHVDQGLAHQIRALRESRGWDQKLLASKLGLRSQSAIARMEDPSYGKLSLATLKKLSKAFDVALLAKFVPFSRLMTEVAALSEENLDVVSFERELPSLERSVLTIKACKIYGNAYDGFVLNSTNNSSTSYIRSSSELSSDTGVQVKVKPISMVYAHD